MHLHWLSHKHAEQLLGVEFDGYLIHLYKAHNLNHEVISILLSDRAKAEERKDRKSLIFFQECLLLILRSFLLVQKQLHLLL